MPTSQSLFSTLHRRWKESLAQLGFWPAARNFAGRIWEFLQESTPAQRRLRYGDTEYDWDHHVDTTRATVALRDRFVEHFHLPYQATEPALFTEMMSNLKIDFQDFTFIDIGSGKGRVLLMAADYPFRRILGIELMPALHRVALENLHSYQSSSQLCFALEAVCCDAREFIFPMEPIVLYLFNPLSEPEMIEAIAHLDRSLSQSPRVMYLLYHNPVLEHVLAKPPVFKKIAGTPQYSIFRTGM